MLMVISTTTIVVVVAVVTWSGCFWLLSSLPEFIVFWKIGEITKQNSVTLEIVGLVKAVYSTEVFEMVSFVCFVVTSRPSMCHPPPPPQRPPPSRSTLNAVSVVAPSLGGASSCTAPPPRPPARPSDLSSPTPPHPTHPEPVRSLRAALLRDPPSLTLRGGGAPAGRPFPPLSNVVVCGRAAFPQPLPPPRLLAVYQL